MTSDHPSHNHTSNEGSILLAFLLTSGFLVAEVIGGFLSGSLALLADAGHMVTDAASLGLAWFAFRLSRKPADEQRSYGYYRFQILAAFINGVSLFVIALVIGIEAIRRFMEPVVIQGTLMLGIAVLGLLINLLVFWILHQGAQENLNLQGALLHIVGDLLGSVAAIAAAVIILFTGWTPIDPLLSILVLLLILRSAWPLIRKSSNILLEGSPEGFNVSTVRNSLIRNIPDVQDAHHIHAWSLTPEKPLLTLHVNIPEHADNDRVLQEIRQNLSKEFGINHATIQVEHNTCKDSRECRHEEKRGS